MLFQLNPSSSMIINRARLTSAAGETRDRVNDTNARRSSLVRLKTDCMLHIVLLKSMLNNTSCSVCGFDFGQTYGPLADGYIHVHHLKPLSARRRRHAVDPVTDLRPVCANCHAAIHLRNPEFTLEELRELMANA